jgi:SAM-dependent methyltransferase
VPSSRDPLAGSPWSRSETVQGFIQSAPNAALLAFAEAELRRRGGRARVLDVGCGAGRNAVPLARLGWKVLGVDLSRPMIAASASRMAHTVETGRLDLVLAPMARLPVLTGCIDLVVAHGIWNLARSGAEFRAAIGEAARVLTPGGGLFVFTFSRHSLPPDTQPVLDESFVFTQFSGEPQCFLTEPQLLGELRAGGFVPDRDVPLRELNRPRPGMLATAGTPVIYEGVFRRVGAGEHA